MQAASDPKKGRPSPHDGRPFEVNTSKRERYGNTGGRTREEIVAILNARGHNLS